MNDPGFSTLKRFFETSSLVVALELDEHGAVVDANAAAAMLLRRPRAELCGIQLLDLVSTPDREAVSAALLGDNPATVVQFVAAEGVFVPLSIHAFAAPAGALIIGEPPLLPYLRLGDHLAEYANELAVEARERGRKAKHLALELEERKRTRWELRRDQEVLPICMGCGRVRTADLGWESLVDFLHRSSDFLSHGYCEPCLQEVLHA